MSLYKTDSEQWCTIPWAPDYDVSDHGRVRSRARNKPTPIILKPAIGKGKNGYPRVVLAVDRKPHTTYIHALVAECFIGPRPTGFTINHKNGIKSDNTVGNLEYTTYSDNNQHAYDTGLHKPVGYDKTFGSQDRFELARKSAESRKRSGIARESRFKAWETRRRNGGR